MEKIVEQGLLYDFYGELLTPHQRRIYEDAVLNDMSLSEIAEEQGISRQGVHDLIRRCDKTLKDGPGFWIIQKLPHGDGLVAQVHMSFHLQASLCRRGGRLDRSPECAGPYSCTVPYCSTTAASCSKSASSTR